MNGFKNVQVFELKQGLGGVSKQFGKNIDHVVCAFNIDNSPLKDIDRRKTIIVDPWLDKVEFADKFLQENEGELSKYIKIPQVDKIYFYPCRDISFPLTDEEISKLRIKYPEFIFKTQ